MKHIGDVGEYCAKNFLQERGYRVIGEQFRSSLGEIDLIIEKENELVFVEVKLRTNQRYGSASEAVDGRKQLKIQQTALLFLAERPRFWNHDIRFDVVALKTAHGVYQIEWIRNAFGEETCR